MVESLIAWLIVGAIAGWLAGLIVKGFGFGLIGNIVIGIIGAVIAGWLLPLIHFPVIGPPIVNAIIDALRPLGIHHLDFPYSPLRLWQAIAAAK